MKCDRCDNEATVHEVRIKGGKRHETHLCEQCAREQGVAIQAPAPITQLLTQFITSQASGEQAGEADASGKAAPITACPTCGTTYAQFRTSGLLGCSTCYQAFEGQLGPLLARAHEGGTHHSGKTPRSGTTGTLPAPKPKAGALPPAASERAPEPTAADRIAEMRAQLDKAVRQEQYELAAKLRDELAKLESKPRPARARKHDRGGQPEDKS